MAPTEDDNVDDNDVEFVDDDNADDDGDDEFSFYFRRVTNISCSEINVLRRTFRAVPRENILALPLTALL